MRGLRSTVKIFFVIMMIISGCVSVCAAEAPEAYIDAYAVDDGQLKIYVNHNQGNGFDPAAENVNVLFGAQEMNVSEILKFGDTGENVSYKCVVDVSGSMDQARIDLAKEMIKAIGEKKKSNDNVSITAFGNTLVQSGYMTDPNEIATKADMLEKTRDDTNLYYCIVEELKKLKSDDSVHNKRCLIIFSDGAEDQATGITREEAENATEESHIPIFTVALLKKGYSKKDEESAKILGSFARLSSGGQHFAPMLDGSDPGQIPDQILSRLNDSLIFMGDLNNIEVFGKEVVLQAAFTVEGGQSASDSINIPEGDVKLIQKEIEELEPEPVVVSEPEVQTVIEDEPMPEPEPEKTIFGLPAKVAYLAGAIALLLIAAVVILIILIKNKKEESYEDGEQKFDDDEADIDDVTLNGMDAGPTMGLTDAGPTMGLTYASPTMGILSEGRPQTGLNVTLTRMGKGETGTYDIKVSDKYTIGRSRSKAQLAFSEDTAMSGLHCTLSSKGKRLFITDNNSTNGTFVNGVPVSGQHELQQDDVVIIGSYEYRVTWK